MTLDDYLVGSLLYFIYYGVPLSVLMMVLVVMQTWTLSRRLDEHLFNEQYFTPQEMIMFSYFPLSLLKTLGYIRLITFPNSLRKRFGVATARDKINLFDLFLSYLVIALMIVCTIFILNLFIAGIVNYIRLEF